MSPITISKPDATGLHSLVAKMCFECGVTSPEAPDVHQAIAAWNTRAHETPLLARIAELEGVNDRLIRLLRALSYEIDDSSGACSRLLIATKEIVREFRKTARAALKQQQP